MPLTTRLEIDDQTNGSNNNTWGDVTDSNLQILEQAIAGVTSISTTGGTTTLTSSQNRFPIIVITGTLVSNATINVRAAEKNWQFINSTTGAFTVTVKTPSGSGQTIGQGESQRFYCDGTNVLRGGTNSFQTGSPDRVTIPYTNNAQSRIVMGSPNNAESSAYLQYDRSNGITRFFNGTTGGIYTECFRAGSLPDLDVFAIPTGTPDRIGVQYTNNAQSRLRFGSPNSGEAEIFEQYDRSTGVFALFAGSIGGSYTERYRINGNTGEFWIANTTDQGAYNLQVGGTGVWAAGAYVNGSDARIKEDVETLTASLEIVNAMRPVTFRYKESFSKQQAVQPGFIAQELQEVISGTSYSGGVVHDGGEFLAVSYQSLIPILVKALQEISAKITALEDRVATLEA
jgi:hypothetical protein